MKTVLASVALSVLLLSCKLEEEKVETVPEYSTLRVQPEQDSLFMNENSETRQLWLTGAILNVSEKTITNSGIMTDVKYTVRTVDTLLQSVNPASAQWYTTNPSVATVSGGLVTARSAGYAQIFAKVGKTSSQTIVVNVRQVNTAPGLTLYPPNPVFIMENSVTVSGLVQQNAILSITEPNSGYNNPVVFYNSDGTFAVTVTGLNEGLRVITARAANPNDISLYNERSKTVLYYAPNSPGANEIVGNWLGTTLGKNFNFTISNSVIPTRYDIAGTIDIDFNSLGLGLGFVKDINLLGVLNHNGSISVALSKETQGFKISGTFAGHFTTTGTGNGTYSAQAVKAGWPKISFNDVWTAVKVP